MQAIKIYFSNPSVGYSYNITHIPEIDSGYNITSLNTLLNNNLSIELSNISQELKDYFNDSFIPFFIIDYPTHIIVNTGIIENG